MTVDTTLAARAFFACPMTETGAGDSREWRPPARGAWNLETAFPYLPSWSTVEGNEAQIYRSILSHIDFTDPVFRPVAGTVDELAFLGRAAGQPLFGLLPPLASISGDAPTNIDFSGTVTIYDDDFPEIRLVSAKPVRNQLELASTLFLRNINLALVATGSAVDDTARSYVELSAELWGKPPGKGEVLLGTATAEVFGDQWRFTVASPPASASQGMSLANLIGLFPVADVAGGADSQAVQEIEAALKGLSFNEVLQQIQIQSLSLRATCDDKKTWTVHSVAITIGAPTVKARLRKTTPCLAIGAPTLSFGYRRLLGLKGLVVEIGGVLEIAKTVDDEAPVRLGLGGRVAINGPKPVLWAELPPPADPANNPNRFNNILATFGAAPIDALASVVVEELALEYVTESGAVFFHGALSGAVALPLKLEFRSGQLNFAYTGSSWSAGITLGLRLKRISFLLGAQYTSANQSVAFKGQLAAEAGEQPIGIDELAKAVEIETPLPDMMRQITITRLEAGITVGGASGWSFDGEARWVVPLANLSVVITAGLKLSRDGDKALVGRVSGNVGFDGLMIDVAYDFAAAGTSLEATLNLAGGIAFTGSWTKGGGDKDQVITLASKGSLTLKQVIEGLAKAVGIDCKLGSPWDFIDKIHANDPTLTYDMGEQLAKLTVKSDFRPINGVDIKITEVTVSYARKGGKSGLFLSVGGSFLGDEFSEKNGNALEWDAAGDPPALPGSGKTLDLRFLGVGQHIKVKGLEAIGERRQGEVKPAGGDNDKKEAPPMVVNAAIAGLKDSLMPPEDKPPAELFDAATGLVVAADFSIKDTFSLAALYVDPAFAGLAVTLEGKRAGALAGLGFELYYRKIGDVGMFSSTFQAPERFRRLGIGPMGLTLGTVTVGMATNGDFDVDFGFPKGGDFRRSFVIDTPTLTGVGGIYLSKKSGPLARSAVRPRDDKRGYFDPVIAAGFGLSVGQKKEVKWGPVSGKLSLMLTVVLEGSCAWWIETIRDASGKLIEERHSEDRYYRFNGLAALSATLDAQVNLAVVKVHIAAQATASVTMVIEAYEPVSVETEIHIAASARVRVAFITVNKSFELRQKVGTRFGERQAAPWGELVFGGQTEAPKPVDDKAAQHKRDQQAKNAVQPPSAELPERLNMRLTPVLIPSARAKQNKEDYFYEVYNLGRYIGDAGTSLDDMEVIGLALTLPVTMDGFGQFVQHLLSNALLKWLKPEDRHSPYAALTLLADHLSENVPPLGEIVGLLDSFTFTLAPLSSMAGDKNIDTVLVAMLPRWRPEFEFERDIRIRPKIPTNWADRVARDYVLLVLRSSIQAIQENWHRLPAGTPFAKVVERLWTFEEDSTPRHPFASVAAFVSAMMMGGAREDRRAIAWMCGQQVCQLKWGHLRKIHVPGASILDVSHDLHIQPYRIKDFTVLTAPTGPLPARKAQPMAWLLKDRYAWEESAEPRLGPAPGAAQPFLRLLPHGMLDMIERLAGDRVAVTAEGPKGPELADLRFVTLVPLEVERSQDETTMRLQGADGADRARLLALWQDLDDPEGPDLTLTLLWSEADEDDGQRRFRSQPLDPRGTRVIQSRLTTVTAGDRALSAAASGKVQYDRGVTAERVSSGLVTPAAFVRRIWQASVTGGDFVLRWVSREGRGWPKALFAQSATATVWLLAIPQSGAAAAKPRRHSNAVVAKEAPGANGIAVVTPQGTNAPTWRVPILEPGVTGFELRRPDPTLDSAKPGDSRYQAMLATAMFNIIHLRWNESEQLHTPAAEGTEWVYAPRLSLLPPPPPQRAGLAEEIWDDRSPYKMIGEASDIPFTFRDGFGNIWPGGERQAKIFHRFYDDPVPLEQWPGLLAGYDFSGDGGGCTLNFTGSLDPTHRPSTAEAQRAAETWKRVYYQCRARGTTCGLRTSANADRLGQRRTLPIPDGDLALFMREAHAYYAVRAMMKPTARVSDAIHRLGNDFPYAFEALLRCFTGHLNAKLSEVFPQGSPVNVPEVSDGAPLGRINGVNDKVASAYVCGLPAKTEVLITHPEVHFPPEARRGTLRETAAALYTTVEHLLDLGDTLPLAQGHKVTVNGVTASTDQYRTLRELALACNLPRSNAPEMLRAIQDVTGLFSPHHFGLRVARLPAGISLAQALIARGVCTGATAFEIADRLWGVLEPSIPVVRSVNAVWVKDQTIKEFLEDNKIALADFVVANAEKFSCLPGVYDVENISGMGVASPQDLPESEEETRAFAEANADLLLRRVVQIQLSDGKSMSTSGALTLRDVAWKAKVVFGVSVSVGELVVRNPDILSGGKWLWLRLPKPWRLSHSITPATANPIEPLEVEFLLRRDPELVDKRYPEAGEGASPIKPAIWPGDAKRSLAAFTEGCERAFPRHKLALGRLPNGELRMHLVDAERSGLAALEVGGVRRYWLPPLELPNRPLEAAVARFDPQRGLLGADTVNQPVDSRSLDEAGVRLFRTIERMIGPDLAGAVYSYDAQSLEYLIEAKYILAEALAQSLIWLGEDKPADDRLMAARERFGQALKRSLEQAHQLDSLVQWETKARSVHPPLPPVDRRKSVPAVSLVTLPEGGRTLQGLEDLWSVNGTVIASLLADVPGILQPGEQVGFRRRVVSIRPHETLRELLARLAAPTPEEIDSDDLAKGRRLSGQMAKDEFFKDHREGAENLFAERAVLPIAERLDIAVKPDDTLASLAERAKMPLGWMARHALTWEGVFLGAEAELVACGLTVPAAQPAERDLRSWWNRAKFPTLAKFARAVKDVRLGLSGARSVLRPQGCELPALARSLELSPAEAVELLEDTPGLLVPEVTITAEGRSVTTSHHMTLRHLARGLGLATTVQLAEVALTAENGLFQPGIALPLVAATAEIAAGETLAAIADRLGLPLRSLIAQWQVRNLVGEIAHQSKRARLETAAAAGEHLKPGPQRVLLPCRTPPRLAGHVIHSGGPAGAEILGPVKVSLANGEASAASPIALAAAPPAGAELRLVLDQLEYDIDDVGGTAGYQSSRWLQLLKPIVLRPLVAQPLVPLRRDLAVLAVAATHEVGDTAAGTWDYHATVHLPAQACEVEAALRFGAPAATRPVGPGLAALAQYAAIAGEVESLMHDLSLPPSVNNRLSGGLGTLAKLATRIARNWGEQDSAEPTPLVHLVRSGSGSVSAKLAGAASPVVIEVQRGAKWETLGPGALELGGDSTVRLRCRSLGLLAHPDAMVSLKAWAEPHGRRSGPLGPPVPAGPSLSLPCQASGTTFEAWLAAAIGKAAREPGDRLRGLLLDAYVDRLEGQPPVRLELGRKTWTLADQTAEALSAELLKALPQVDVKAVRVTLVLWSPVRGGAAPYLVAYEDLAPAATG